MNDYIFLYSIYIIKDVNVCDDEIERSYTFGFCYPIKKREKQEREFNIESWSDEIENKRSIHEGK